MVGLKKQDFFPRNNIFKEKDIRKIPLMNDGPSKSAKIVLSKLIFDVKNRQIFFFFSKTYLKDHFMVQK